MGYIGVTNRSIGIWYVIIDSNIKYVAAEFPQNNQNLFDETNEIELKSNILIADDGSRLLTVYQIWISNVKYTILSQTKCLTWINWIGNILKSCKQPVRFHQNVNVEPVKRNTQFAPQTHKFKFFNIISGLHCRFQIQKIYIDLHWRQ